MSPPPKGVYDELLWVHSILRRDLAAVRKLAHSVRGGAAPAQVRSKIKGLQTKGPLWQLKTNCLSYCAFVHAHHSGEDRTLFPAVRRSDPARMTPVVNRLEADHRKVSDLLDEVEASARFLDTGDETRRRLARALDDLADHLLEHLAYEEKALAPLLRTWKAWPTAR